MKVKINSRFRAYWGPITPKVGDVVKVVKEDKRGYWVTLGDSRERYLVFRNEADLVKE